MLCVRRRLLHVYSSCTLHVHKNVVNCSQSRSNLDTAVVNAVMPPFACKYFDSAEDLAHIYSSLITSIVDNVIVTESVETLTNSTRYDE